MILKDGAAGRHWTAEKTLVGSQKHMYPWPVLGFRNQFVEDERIVGGSSLHHGVSYCLAAEVADHSHWRSAEQEGPLVGIVPTAQTTSLETVRNRLLLDKTKLWIVRKGQESSDGRWRCVLLQTNCHGRSTHLGPAALKKSTWGSERTGDEQTRLVAEAK